MLDIEFVSLSNQPNLYSDKEIIDMRQETSKILNKAFLEAKNKKCLLCGKECSSFCNSHSIPDFIIRQVAENGKVVTGMNFLPSPLLEDNTGRKKTNVFFEICDECDNTLFNDYENPSKILKPFSQKMLNQIVLKNYLRLYNKRKYDNEVYKIFVDPDYQSQRLDNKLLLSELDMKYYYEKILKLKTLKNKFYVIDEFVLDYRCKFSFQSNLTLVTGFDGEIINNIYRYDKNFKSQELYLCVFPYNDKTKVILFIEDGCKGYRIFYKKYRDLSINDKLCVLNEIILKYSEEFIVSPSCKDYIINSRYTMNAISMTTDVEIESDDYTEITNYDLFKQNSIKKAVELFRIKIDRNLINLFEFKLL